MIYKIYTREQIMEDKNQIGILILLVIYMIGYRIGLHTGEIIIRTIYP